MGSPLKLATLIVIGPLLLSCGTYRTGTGDYKGVGSYKNPSDYSTGIDSSEFSNSDQIGPRDRLNKRPQYFPREPFKLFWPVERVQVNRGFHPPDDPAHAGVDLGGKKGMPILAAHEGIIIYAGREFNGYGNMVLLEFNSEWATLYGHLDEIIAREGQIVLPGDPLGTMGATGHATGVHLHFEVMRNRQPTDPIPLLTRPGRYASKIRK